MPLIDTVKADLRRDEGLRTRPYRCSENVLTIGVGRNLEAKGITPTEAEYLLSNDVAEVWADLDRLFPWWQGLSYDQRRGLANLCFQLGATRLRQFKRVLAALEAHNGPAAAVAALDSLWARQTPERAQRVAKLLERD